MNVVTLPELWRSRAIVVTDVPDRERWFSEDELAAIRAFRLEKRRREWMLSRIAEKELRRRGGEGASVSYSHSGEYGAAAIGEGPIGVDVEIIRTIPHGAVHLFLTDEETEAAARSSVAHALLHFWSAKEARWKQLGGAVPTLKRVGLTLLGESESGLRFAEGETFSDGRVVVALSL